MEKITGNNCTDSTDKRNYLFEDYAKEFAEWEKINSRPYKEIILRDQWQTPRCTRYALTHISNWQNIREYEANWLKYTQLNPDSVWDKWDKRKFLMNALDDFKKFWLIEGYLEIKKDANMFKNIDKALSMGLYIYTGSDNWLWGNYSYPYIYQTRNDWKVVWHAYPIVDKKSDGNYTGPQSFGKDFWDNWYLNYKPEQLNGMFTLYAIVDKDETWKFSMFKLKEKIKQFVELGKYIYDNADTKTRQKFITRSISDYFKEYLN